MGGGHAYSMINRLKENRSLLKSRSVKEKSRDAFLSYGEIRKKPVTLHHKKADPKILLRFRNILKRDKAKQQKKLKLMVVTLLLLSLIIIYAIFNFMGLL